MLNAILYSPVAVDPIIVGCTPTFMSELTTSTSGTFASSLVISASGGVAPYTYAWSKTSTAGDGTISISSPTASSTMITFSGLTYNGAEAYAVIKCLVTDSNANTAYVNVSVDVVRSSGGGVIP